MNTAYTVSSVVTLLTCLYFAGCATTPRISYQRDVRPIFVDKCLDCHISPDGAGYRKTGLDMKSYQALMEGSIYGPAIVPGNSKTSPLNILVEGRAGDLTRVLNDMHKPVTDHEVRVLHLWVEQGALNN